MGFWTKIGFQIYATEVKKNNFGPCRQKTCLPGFANNTGADHHAHLRSLISAFVNRFLKNFICKLAITWLFAYCKGGASCMRN